MNIKKFFEEGNIVTIYGEPGRGMTSYAILIAERMMR